MVKPELGTKRVCPSCAIKFYDLLKDPIECPACSATFVADPILPSKNDAPPPAEPEKAAVEEAEADTDGDVEVVSLEDVDEGDSDTEDADVAAAAEIADVEIDDDDSSDDSGDKFLEDDDEENGDVSGIIGGVAPKSPTDT